MLPQINGTCKWDGRTIVFPNVIVTNLKETAVLAERLPELQFHMEDCGCSRPSEIFFIRGILGPTEKSAAPAVPDSLPASAGALSASVASLPASVVLSEVSADSLPGSYELRGTPVEGEYALSIQPEGITIIAADRKGFCYGLTTLYQVVLENDGNLPCGEIHDRPAYQHRGFLLDSSRHFFDVKTVKSMIEEASIHKMSVIHWHFSDDQGYRMPSCHFPELNEEAHYSAADVKEIIAYASMRGIDILPEIDLPGHTTAILQKHPEFSCSGEPVARAGGAGVFDRILCAGNPDTMIFVKTLLDEICELFPYEKFHIGGDEAPKKEWCKCLKCQKKIKKLSLKDEEELQAWFTNEVSSYLITKGKTPVCWNEVLRSDKLDERVTIQYWDEENSSGTEDYYCRSRLEKEYRWIYSFTPDFYFDYGPSLCPMRKMAGVKNQLRSGEIIPDGQLLGYECTLWSEQIATQERLQELAFPRMYAVAELGWSKMPDYAEFETRCRKEVEFAHQRSVNVTSVEDANPTGPDQHQQILDEWKPRMEIMRKEGLAHLLPGIPITIRKKLEDCMSKEEIEAILSELMSR